MSPNSSETAKRHQVTVSLSEAERDILRAVAFLDGTSEANVLRPVVETHLAQRALELSSAQEPADI